MGCSNCVVFREKRTPKPYEFFDDGSHYSTKGNNSTDHESRYSSPSLNINKSKEDFINISPKVGTFEEGFSEADSRQRLHESTMENQLAPAQIQGFNTASPQRLDSPAIIQDINRGLWDEVFCGELEFLEEVFHDRSFRYLSGELPGDRADLVRNYVRSNESWGFASLEKKHSFVTNVLHLYGSYLPREEGQKLNSWHFQTHPSWSDCKMTVSGLWAWWLDYVEEMSSRYLSLLSRTDGGQGVELLVSHLLESMEYPKELILKLKPQVAQNIWSNYEKEINKVKNNLKETFSLKICPTNMEEDQQDFLNNYISRSFIPCMLGILMEVILYISNHPSVVEFDSQRGLSSIARKNNLWREAYEDINIETRSSLPNTPWSQKSASTCMSAWGLHNDDSIMSLGSEMKTDSKLSYGNEPFCSLHSKTRYVRTHDEQKSVFPHTSKWNGRGTNNLANISIVKSAPIPTAKNIREMDIISSIQNRNTHTEGMGMEFDRLNSKINIKVQTPIIIPSDESLVGDTYLRADCVPPAKNKEQQREA